MKNWSDGVVESWSVGIIRLKALLQYSNTPTKRILCLTLCVILFALCFPVDAQQAKKVPRIGFLEGATVAESQGIEPFRQGLRELGYVEGRISSSHFALRKASPIGCRISLPSCSAAKSTLSSRQLRQQQRRLRRKRRLPFLLLWYWGTHWVQG